jgi:hypothetical protein
MGLEGGRVGPAAVPEDGVSLGDHDLGSPGSFQEPAEPGPVRGHAEAS